MRQSWLIISALLLNSCISTRPKTKSNWAVLDSAKIHNCEKIPRKKSDLAILDIEPFQGNFKIANGLVFSARQRKGVNYNYLAALDGVEVELEKQHKFIWGNGASYLGQIDIAGKTHVVVKALDQANFKRIEIRSIEDNIVRYSSKRLPYSFRGLKVLPSKSGLWLVFKHAKAQTSLDDMPTEIVEAKYGDDDKLDLNLSKSFKIPGDSKVVGFGIGRIAAFFAQQLPGKLGRVKLSYTIFDTLEKKPTVIEYSDESIDRLESWAISPHRDGILLVFVSGDTLIWENAKMDIVAFDNSGDTSWSKSYPIEGEHVGEPHLVHKGSKTYLVQPKWLDSESTLQVSEIGRSGLNSLGYHGIFSEGTFLYRVFDQPSEDGLYIISRYPEGFGKGHDICEISL